MSLAVQMGCDLMSVKAKAYDLLIHPSEVLTIVIFFLKNFNRILHMIYMKLA